MSKLERFTFSFMLITCVGLASSLFLIRELARHVEKTNEVNQANLVAITELQAARSIDDHFEKINKLCSEYSYLGDVTYEGKSFEVCPSGRSFKLTCQFKSGTTPRRLPITTIYNIMYKTAYVDCFSAEVWKEFFNDGKEEKEDE